jgi:peptide/nickel transport system permease protein
MPDLVRRLAMRPAAASAAAFALVLVVVALFAPILAGHDPRQISNTILSGPLPGHPLGTDDLGRDVLSNLLYGSRVALAVGIATALAATLFGVVIGAYAAFYGKLADPLLMRITEVFQVMPSFILAAVIVALVGAGLGTVILVIAILAWPQVARVTRAEVLRLRAADFVSAGRCMGLRDSEIIWREIVPNALAPVISLGTLVVAQTILLQSGLSFLGLSDPSIPSWGNMLNDAQPYLSQAWWLAVSPGLAIFFTVMAFNILGDSVHDLLSPIQSR